MAVFTTSLSSANFALNCAEGDATALSRLFSDMTEAQARRILDNPNAVFRGPDNNQITVADRIVDPV